MRLSARARLLVAVAVVALLIVLLTSGGGRHRGPRPVVTGVQPPRVPAPAVPALGMNVNRLFNDRIYSLAEIGQQLQALRHTGVTDARSDALWEATEPQPPSGGVHHYNWTFDDLLVAELALHHLRWLSIVDYSAPWAQSIPGQEHSAPSFPAGYAGYAAYAASLAARYGPVGTFWRLHPALPVEPVSTFEIWNEPDGGHFWLPRSQPGPYADLYLAARHAIKAVDPGARVLIGGVTNPPLFLPQLFAAQPLLRGHVDGVAVHPYLPTPSAMLGWLKTARETMDRLGMTDVPLYVTEFGWTVRPRGAPHWVPGRVRPAYIRRSFADLAHTDCGIAGAYLYTWVTPGRDPRNGEDWFGIHLPRAGSRQNTLALADGIAAARRPGPPIRLCG